MAASVFDIHPLVEAIARNLSPEELCCCLRVSYAWRTNFSPYLWRRIRLYSEQHYGKFNTPLTLGALARRTNQVQIVETNIPRLLDLLSDTYPLYNLSTLRVGALGCSSSSLVQLLGQSTNLQTLELLGYFGPGPVVEQFLSTLRSHPRLRELSVTTGSYTYTPKAMIWRLLLSCGNLETIFAKTHFDTKEFPPTSEALMAEVRELTGSETPSFKVKDLTIGPSLYSGDDLFASFLRFCPNVVRLNGIDYSPEFVPEFLVLQLGRLKKLEGLVLRRVTQMGLGVEAKLQALHEELYEMGRQQVTHLFETLSTLPEMRRVELQGMREAMVILEIDKAKQCWNYIEALSYYDENIRYY
ncbi:hypothetical protein BG005_011563 [Podila minutissima]|nr:hypothetical protein BG005_011563 [Podila minutissima]